MMTPEQQSYLPAIAERAKEWVYTHKDSLFWKKNDCPICDGTGRVDTGGFTPFGAPIFDGCTCEPLIVRPTELLQLMQWIEEREGLDKSDKNGLAMARATYDIVERGKTYAACKWHERWQAICKVRGWKATL